LPASIDGFGKDAELTVAGHLKAHGMPADGRSWIADGTDYAASDNCPFCG
jgi:wobble nucleotide-excising tRNase